MSLRAYGAAAALAGAFAAGWAFNGWRLQAAHNAEAAERARQAVQLLERRDDLARTLQAQNDRNLTKLEEAQRETNRLRTCLAAGTCGLRVVATLPAPGPRVPEAPAGTGVDLGDTAGSATAAGRAYLALREGIDRAGAQLAACQAELRLRTANP